MARFIPTPEFGVRVDFRASETDYGFALLYKTNAGLLIMHNPNITGRGERFSYFEDDGRLLAIREAYYDADYGSRPGDKLVDLSGQEIKIARGCGKSEGVDVISPEITPKTPEEVVEWVRASYEFAKRLYEDERRGILAAKQLVLGPDRFIDTKGERMQIPDRIVRGLGKIAEVNWAYASLRMQFPVDF